MPRYQQVRFAGAAIGAAGAFANTASSLAPRRHQRLALEAFEDARARGDRSAYLVLPPGAGKTLVGLEVARRLGRPALVLGPNTAIQAQWLAQWERFRPATVTATADRALPTPLTVLTYQALCTLDPELAADEPETAPAERHRRDRRRRAADGDPEALFSLLHSNGRALIERLRDSGPWTLVLDECHHLLELWGHLLRAVVAELDDPFVLGLTATPPRVMNAEQAAVHKALFGHVDLEVSTPAVVREGQLAPYQELVYLTTPTPSESAYMHGEAERFAELRTDLLSPGFGSTSFLGWLQARVVERRSAQGAPVSWSRFERDRPELADAAVRLHVAGLLPLPEGARVREQHRHPPTAQDWVALLEDYCRGCLHPSEDPRDAAAFEAIRRALPAVGYTLTSRGVRAGSSPVDRVLARSANKGRAAVEILRAESAELGPRLRALVLCDHERAVAELPARLTGVLDPQAGGARLLLETLAADPDTALLDPVLVTGRTVAAPRATAARLVAWLRDAAPGLTFADPPPAVVAGGPDPARADDPVEVSAGTGWTPRRYVPLVTRFFEQGGSRCLVGTRGLLGEGWDARTVNVLVDLTAATTPTSVVQARGRALRLDEGWPEKVADNWGVVCVSEGHPKGVADYERFVRKHDGYFALTESGDISSGVSHVDPELSPYTAPPAAGFDALNARMLTRVGQREVTRERWAVGTPYDDEAVGTVTVRAARPLGLAGRAAVPLVAPADRRGGRRGTVLVAALVAAAAGAPGYAAAGPGGGLGGAGGALVLTGAAALARQARELSRVPAVGTLEDMAAAVAAALYAGGLGTAGADAVVVEPRPDGAYRALLAGVPAAESARFAEALDELLSPLAAPRYVVPRLVVAHPAGRGAALGLAVSRLVRRPVLAAVVYHAVPAVLGTTRSRVDLFGAAWNRLVSPGRPLYTGSPEGAGVLAAQRGDDPFAVTTQLRTLWR